MNENIEKAIYEIIERYDEECDPECKEEIENYLKHHGIEQYEVSIDEMFDGPGGDVYSVSVAWVKDGKLELAVGSVGTFD